MAYNCLTITKKGEASMEIGDKVKVINQEITGTITEYCGNSFVIVDDSAETLDDRLEYKKSELKLIK